LLKRAAWLLPTLLLSSLLGFFLMRLHLSVGPWVVPALPPLWAKPVVVLPFVELRPPVDPLADLRQNPQISRQALAKEEKRLALNKPWWVQYGLWLGALLQGDLGKTNKGEDVSWLLLSAAGNTLLLNVATLLCSWGIAFPLGVWAACKAGTGWDATLNAVASVLMACPSVLLTLALGLWVVQSGCLPFGGLHSAQSVGSPWWVQWGDVAAHLVLPVAVLTLGSVPALFQQARGQVLESLDQECLNHARAKGLPYGRVLWVHAVRQALNPLVVLLGFELAGLLSGSVLVETILGYPGLGYITYQGALASDANLVMASLVVSSLLLVVGNVLADAALLWLNPTLRDQPSGSL
jgi:peptide/nickel transport system permease protein